MGELYIRKVIVEIIPQNGTGKKIEDLRINFSCEKNSESAPNKCEIGIYNLSDSTRSLLEAKNTRVKLSIGYLGLKPNGIGGSGVNSTSTVELVFIGNVKKITQDIQTPDIITKLELADGGNAYRNARLDKGYPPSTDLKLIIDDLITSTGLSKGSISGLPSGKKYANGYTVSGLSRDNLDTITKSNELEWSIQNEAIQIVKRGEATNDTLIVLTPDTGLIGSPNKTDKGVEFISLLQPTLKPGRKVQLKSRFLEGTFKIRKVVDVGDSHQGDFLSKCEAAK